MKVNDRRYYEDRGMIMPEVPFTVYNRIPQAFQTMLSHRNHTIRANSIKELMSYAVASYEFYKENEQPVIYDLREKLAVYPQSAAAPDTIDILRHIKRIKAHLEIYGPNELNIKA